MKYEREITKRELDSLGREPTKVLNEVLTNFLARISDPYYVECQILLTIDIERSLTIKEIVDLHNEYFPKSIKMPYARLIVNNLFNCGIIKRVERGRYARNL